MIKCLFTETTANKTVTLTVAVTVVAAKQHGIEPVKLEFTGHIQKCVGMCLRRVFKKHKDLLLFLKKLIDKIGLRILGVVGVRYGED